METSYRTTLLWAWKKNGGASIMHRIACDCLDQRHDIVIGVDTDFQDIIMTFYVDTSIINPYRNEYGFAGWIKEKWWNIKQGIKLCFGSNLETQQDFILAQDTQIDEVIRVLQEAEGFLVEREKENKG